MADSSLLTKIIKFFYFVLILLSIDSTSCDRVLNKIYEPIQSNHACFKRFNGTHEIGCSSSFGGNVGVIHIVDSDESFEWFINKGPHTYVLALLPEYFTPAYLNKAWNSGKISGALLLNSETRPEHFSGDFTCPNEASSFYKNTSYSSYCSSNPWNKFGSSILYENWHFPIFYINDENSIKNIYDCYNNFSKPLENGEPRNWPLCAVELKSSMHGTGNSEICIRRSQSNFLLDNQKFCDPLEQDNIWSTVRPLNATEEIEEKSVIIVAAGSDASSMFNNISPGAESAITGLITLLATAEALYKNIDNLDGITKNIIFVFYEGEAWDYIGSSRMVYDMSKNEFPYKVIDGQEDQMSQLNLTHIDAVIDLKQLGIRNKNGQRKLFIHTDPISSEENNIFWRNKAISNSLINAAKKFDLDIEMVKPDNNMTLPPSSLQSFLKEDNFAGFVLSDHHKEYRNNYYQSIYDDASNLNFKSDDDINNNQLVNDLTIVSSSLASSLHHLLTNKTKNIEADPEIVYNLLYCTLENSNCSYFRNYSDHDMIYLLQPIPTKMYVSVKRYVTDHVMSYMTIKLLSFFMGNRVDYNYTTCISNNSQVSTLTYYPFIDNGTCIESNAHASSALSPAFTIEDYDWKSGQYSTWTESIWDKMEVRIFLKPSPSEEISLVIGGVFSMISSIILVYFMNSKAKIIFLSDVPPTPC